MFEAQVRNNNVELKGEIRLSVPLYFGQESLSSHLLEFAETHPDLRLNIEFDDRLVDVIREHYDLVIRPSGFKLDRSQI